MSLLSTENMKKCLDTAMVTSVLSTQRQQDNAATRDVAETTSGGELRCVAVNLNTLTGAFRKELHVRSQQIHGKSHSETQG